MKANKLRAQQMMIATKTMRMDTDEALAWLAERGIKTSRTTYHATLNRVSRETTSRLYEICKNFRELHVAKIDTLNQVEQELWKLYRSMDQVVRTKKTEAKGTDKNGNPMHTKNAEPLIIEIPLPVGERRAILREIAELQPYRSAFEESTKMVMEETAKFEAAKDLGIPAR